MAEDSDSLEMVICEDSDPGQGQDDQTSPDFLRYSGDAGNNSKIENNLNLEDNDGNGEMIVPDLVPASNPSSSSAAYAQPRPRPASNSKPGRTGKKRSGSAKQKKSGDPDPGALAITASAVFADIKALKESKRHEKFLQSQSRKDLPAYKAWQNREKKKAEKEKLEADFAALKAKNNVQFQEIEDLRAENSFLESRICVAEHDKNVLQAEFDALVHENERLRQRIQKLFLQINPPK